MKLVLRSLHFSENGFKVDSVTSHSMDAPQKCQPHDECRHRRKAGFSLVEMLVVVAILVVLVALIIPVISIGIENGKEAKCLGNVRTMTAVALSWIADHGYNNTTTRSLDWGAELIPTYLPAELRCPSMPSNKVNSQGWRYAIQTIATNFGAYVTSPAAVSRIVLTSEMYYLPDGFWDYSHLNMTMNGSRTGGVKHSHMGGLNMGMADGHAELVKAPIDASGNIQWLKSPTYTHDLSLKTGYVYDQRQWFWIMPPYNRTVIPVSDPP